MMMLIYLETQMNEQKTVQKELMVDFTNFKSGFPDCQFIAIDNNNGFFCCLRPLTGNF